MSRAFSCLVERRAVDGCDYYSARRRERAVLRRSRWPTLGNGETVRAEEIVPPDGRSPMNVEGELDVDSDHAGHTPLEELERLRAEFLGMVSHELRTVIPDIIKGSVLHCWNFCPPGIQPKQCSSSASSRGRQTACAT